MSSYRRQSFVRKAAKKTNASKNAAEYLRASTEHQEYSVENQHMVIAEYAARHDLSIVRSYTDPGRTGLTFKDRPGIKQLISDIQSGEAPFQVVLVSDVSRWGRFQDTDESAYYEFLCRSNGISIRYCLEQFENNGPLINSVMKSLKRAMAGEYSRDLSNRVWLGQKKGIGLGFHQGGVASYGLRRMLVDARGRPRGILRPSDRKYLNDDRVILVPGPKKETDLVREIFQLYVEGTPKKRIARILNSRGLFTSRGKQWSDHAIDGMLRSERYIGNLVYNRSSLKLGAARILLPEKEWIRAEGVIKPIVPEKLFNLAQLRLRNVWPISDNDLLDYLTAGWCVNGYLTTRLIDANPMLPAAHTYVDHFGSLYNAYRLIGFKPPHRYRNRRLWPTLRRLDCQITGDIITSATRVGATVTLDDETHVLTIDGRSVGLALVPFTKGPPQIDGWRLYLKYVAPCDRVLLGLLDESNSKIFSFYLIPREKFTRPSVCLNRLNLRRFSDYKISRVEKLAGELNRMNDR
jgi:DNA invertase Pin-like site-specific DNA recombinase